MCLVLIFLLILTFLGTLEQIDHGIYEVQRKYFSSFFLVYKINGTIPIPLPGGGLLMGFLFVNLIYGAFKRIRKTWLKAGILIVHFGMATLLLSGFITYAFSFDGHMTLYENEKSNTFQSYFEWEVVVLEPLENGKVKETIIPFNNYLKIPQGNPIQLNSNTLPFTLEFVRYFRNSQPFPADAVDPENSTVIEGYFLKEIPLVVEAEHNIPGLHLNIIHKETGLKQNFLLWGGQRYPLHLEMGKKNWFIDLRNKRWEVPFTIKLDQFTREFYPGTGIAKIFMSDVSKIENDISQSVKISMNEPLRHKGYTFFQASWGPSNAKPGEPLFSSFAVVKNPADKLPEYACYIMGIGLIIHFSITLSRYIKRQNKPVL